MTPESKKKLKELLVSHESYKQFPYVDTTGHITIGIGRNLTERGVSHNEAYTLLDDDILYFTDKLSQLDWFVNLDEIRQLVLVDMCFNLGLNNLLNFKEMIKYLKVKNYEGAAQEMIHSKWAEQVKDRAVQLADIMEIGNL